MYLNQIKWENSRSKCNFSRRIHFCILCLSCAIVNLSYFQDWNWKTLNNSKSPVCKRERSLLLYFIYDRLLYVLCLMHQSLASNSPDQRFYDGQWQMNIEYCALIKAVISFRMFEAGITNWNKSKRGTRNGTKWDLYGSLLWRHRVILVTFVDDMTFPDKGTSTLTTHHSHRLNKNVQRYDIVFASICKLSSWIVSTVGHQTRCIDRPINENEHMFISIH